MKTLPVGLIIAMLIFLVQSDAYSIGDHGAGNGGDVVVCFEKSEAGLLVKEAVSAVAKANRRITDPKLYRDPLSEKITTILGLPGTPLDYIRDVTMLDLFFLSQKSLAGTTKRMEWKDGDYKALLKWIKERLYEKTNFWKRVNLISLNALPLSKFYPAPNGVYEIVDEGTIPRIFPECEVIQMARQFRLGGDLQVEYDARLFEKMDEVNKAAMIFHEWLTPVRQASDSENLRTVVAAVFSKEFQYMAGSKLNQILRDAGLTYETSLDSREFFSVRTRYGYQEILTETNTIRYQVDGSVFFEPLRSTRLYLDSKDEEIRVHPGFLVEVHRNGMLKGATLLYPLNRLGTRFRDRIRFYDDGSLRWARLDEDFNSPPHGLTFPSGSALYFFKGTKGFFPNRVWLSESVDGVWAQIGSEQIWFRRISKSSHGPYYSDFYNDFDLSFFKVVGGVRSGHPDSYEKSGLRLDFIKYFPPAVGSKPKIAEGRIARGFLGDLVVGRNQFYVAGYDRVTFSGEVNVDVDIYGLSGFFKLVDGNPERHAVPVETAKGIVKCSGFKVDSERPTDSITFYPTSGEVSRCFSPSRPWGSREKYSQVVQGQKIPWGARMSFDREGKLISVK